jgi:hypothetical protein
MSYDIFISYRRKGAGAGVAGELQAKFDNRGYKVFLDVDNIGSGEFPQQIDNAIKECNDFLLILSPGMLDRCSDEEDWVRHEIMLAEQYGKNIVGVSLPGFVMPEVLALPEPLRKIPEIQVFLWSHEYRNASINKIEENLVSFARKKKRSRRNLTIEIICGLVVAIAAWLLLSKPMSKPVEEPEVVTEPEVVVDDAQFVRDSFIQFVSRGDELLKQVENPSSEEDMLRFMECMNSYQSALNVVNKHPELRLDSYGLNERLDSLSNLRKQRLQQELDAATKLMNVDQYDFATFRFNNAKALATEADQPKLEAVARRLNK